MRLERTHIVRLQRLPDPAVWPPSEAHCEMFAGPWLPICVGMTRREAEDVLFAETLRVTANKRDAAIILGVALKTVYNRLPRLAWARRVA